MILDKLTEKKDLLAYIQFREDALRKDKNEVVPHEKPELRENIIRRIDGRLSELEYLRNVVTNNQLKNKSKWYFELITKRERS